ncbi:dialkylrecorsinol condensing enzyme [uncultured Hyphomonas sp.]|uniref:dialkylrecorsinol condensing enzyme n=1 Tax=uncultured Hyphomonas sp. TaxID=225298 RepID=UPI002AAB714B|nr:dialkylrecorsinol condensing enzyme [uncultured Hyphomonas sp.]
MSGTHRILALNYSQTGQLQRILDSICAPLCTNSSIEIVRVNIRPARPYPFPWPILPFFDVFPETVGEVAVPFTLDWPDGAPECEADFDLVLLAYQPWFLSVAQPMMSFLKSRDAQRLLAGRRVITIIGCRNMWLMAQERMKVHLSRLDAHLIDNIVLTDSAHSMLTFFSTPLWMLTGRKGPWLGGQIPEAGISDTDIKDASRFGHAIESGLEKRTPDDLHPMLDGTGAITINERLIDSEKFGKRSFILWGALLRFLGRPGSFFRRSVLLFYILFLITIIVTLVPLFALLKLATRPFFRKRAASQRAYYAAPTGEGRERIDAFGLVSETDGQALAPAASGQDHPCAQPDRDQQGNTI